MFNPYFSGAMLVFRECSSCWNLGDVLMKFCEKSNVDSIRCSYILILYPNTPCMEYLPTFGLNLW